MIVFVVLVFNKSSTNARIDDLIYFFDFIFDIHSYFDISRGAHLSKKEDIYKSSLPEVESVVSVGGGLVGILVISVVIFIYDMERQSGTIWNWLRYCSL